MRKHHLNTTEPVWVKTLLIGISVIFLFLIILVPLVAIFYEAFARGINYYFSSLADPDTIAAIKLSLFVTAIVVPLNACFGLAASWAIGKFRFRGRQLLTTLIDLPLSVSPVIAGLIFILIFSVQAPIGKWLSAHRIEIIFAVPGIIIATTFVTISYVARELIPLMQQQGNDEEEAAHLLGAKGFKMFLNITVPNIKWGLLYGILLCTARSLGEFGAVSVVSGHIRGLTNTLPLHVEILYNDYKFSEAFAASSILTLLALLTLILKVFIELHGEIRTKL